MQKWEYTSCLSSYDERKEIWIIKGLGNEYEKISDMLNALGDEGWELVSTSPYTGTTVTESGKPLVNTIVEYFYFKRPKE